MFLQVEGFQVEFKEVNKSWDQAHQHELKIGQFYTGCDQLLYNTYLCRLREDI